VIFKRITYDASKFPPISGHCRYCKKPLENKRLSWCGGALAPGDSCWRKAMAECSWPFLRRQVVERANGKCEMCGFDIAGMMKALNDYRHNASEALRLKTGLIYNHQAAIHQTKQFARLMYGVKARLWWNDCGAVDHIIPIAEGGHPLPGLEGLRYLCLECHDKVTAELRKRMSERRKRHRWMPLFPNP
jgi:5-methylcytosine-specific restriction endonuclease McrA